MEWSNELTLEFLGLYEKEPSIWNPNDPFHKNRNCVHDAWKRIENQLSGSFSIEDLKKKKDSLMATFRPLNNKVKRSMKSGSGADDVFKPNWYFYQPMAKFLHSIYQPKTTINTEDIEDSINEENEDISTELPQDSSSSSVDTECVFRSPAAKVAKKRKNDSILDDCMMNVYKVMQNVTSKPPKDKCTLFTELLDKKLRAFDENTMEILMHEIDELLFRAKMATQRRDIQSYSPTLQLVNQFPSTASAFNYTPYSYSLNTPTSSDTLHHSSRPPSYSSESSNHTQPSPVPFFSQYSSENNLTPAIHHSPQTLQIIESPNNQYQSQTNVQNFEDSILKTIN